MDIDKVLDGHLQLSDVFLAPATTNPSNLFPTPFADSASRRNGMGHPLNCLLCTLVLNCSSRAPKTVSQLGPHDIEAESIDGDYP